MNESLYIDYDNKKFNKIHKIIRNENGKPFFNIFIFIFC